MRVGDAVVSEASIVDELDAYGNNEALFAAAGGSEAIRGDLRDSYQQSFVGDLVEQRIIFMLSEQIFDDEGLELSDADRQQAERLHLLADDAGSTTSRRTYRTSFVDDVARTNVLSDGARAGGVQRRPAREGVVDRHRGVLALRGVERRLAGPRAASRPGPGPQTEATGGQPLPAEPTG